MFNENILKPFLEIIEKFADNNAFCIADKHYTYLEFAQHISKIRAAVRTKNNKHTNIGLVANDDIETYASIFAIWLEGFSYVPLHPHQPIERSLEIISQADIDLIINSNNSNIFLTIQTIESARLEFKELNLLPIPTADSGLAYILFTSGSTGKPKGVQITRGNVGAFMKSFWETNIKNGSCSQRERI